MENRSKFLVVGASALALAAGGGGLAIAGSSDGGSVDAAEDAAEGPDVAISGEPKDEASAAALDHVGEGEVSGTEVGDEESYYEVEVTRDDGTHVDVQVDRDFNVVSQESDGKSDSD